MEADSDGAAGSYEPGDLDGAAPFDLAALGHGRHGGRRKRRKRGEQPHSQGTPYSPLGSPVLVLDWARGQGSTRLVTRDALDVALEVVLQGGQFASCHDGGRHSLKHAHLPLKSGREGYRVTCTKRCGLALRAMMNVGGEGALLA